MMRRHLNSRLTVSNVIIHTSKARHRSTGDAEHRVYPRDITLARHLEDYIYHAKVTTDPLCTFIGALFCPVTPGATASCKCLARCCSEHAEDAAKLDSSPPSHIGSRGSTAITLCQQLFLEKRQTSLTKNCNQAQAPRLQ